MRGTLAHFRAEKTVRRLVLLLLTLSLFSATACGRKPSTLEAPENSVDYTYPPRD